MSFLSNLFGGTFESNAMDGDDLFSQKAWGEARLAYERALGKARDARQKDVEEVREKLKTCRLELARMRIEEADELAAQGFIEEAREILADIPAICDDESIRKEASEHGGRYDADEARRLASEGEDMTEEDLLAVIAGTWTEAQANEYASLPDSFREAILLGHDGKHARAAEIMKEVLGLEEPDVEPRYAYFELGKELAQAGMSEESMEMIDQFLTITQDDEEAVEMRMAAVTVKGSLLLDLNRVEEADEVLVAATKEIPGHHAPYLNLGVFLRNRGEMERSLAALEKAVELMGQMHPDFRVIREIGFTYLAMDRKDEAEQNLFAVVEHQASQGNHDQLDPEASVALARLYEEKNEIEKAADIFRHLAVGHDTVNHFTYNLESARLLNSLSNNPQLADRYLARARELASNDSEHMLVANVAGNGEADS